MEKCAKCKLAMIPKSKARLSALINIGLVLSCILMIDIGVNWGIKALSNQLN